MNVEKNPSNVISGEANTSVLSCPVDSFVIYYIAVSAWDARGPSPGVDAMFTLTLLAWPERPLASVARPQKPKRHLLSCAVPPHTGCISWKILDWRAPPPGKRGVQDCVESAVSARRE